MTKKSNKRQKEIVVDVTESVKTAVDMTAVDVAQQEDSQEDQTAVPGENQVQVDVEYLRTTKIHCAIPCSNGTISEAGFVSFLKFAGVARQLGIEWTVETTANDALLPRARNTLVAKFLSRPDSTHLVFIDGDVSWEPWQLLVLINRQLDIVGGLYSIKSLPIRWVLNTFPGAEETEDGLHQVSKIGCGFLAIKRDVFEKLASHESVKPYKNDVGLDSNLDTYLRTYFDTSVSDGVYLSEDWTFCDRWTQMGGKIYVDKRVMLGNIGAFQYSAQTQDQLLNVLGPQYVDIMRKREMQESSTSIIMP